MCEDPQATRGSVGRGPLALSSFPFYRNLDHLALSWIRHFWPALPIQGSSFSYYINPQDYYTYKCETIITTFQEIKAKIESKES